MHICLKSLNIRVRGTNRGRQEQHNEYEINIIH